MVVITEEDHVNHWGTTSRNGQASHCHRCCASQTTQVNERPLQHFCQSTTNDAWASWDVLAIFTRREHHWRCSVSKRIHNRHQSLFDRLPDNHECKAPASLISRADHSRWTASEGAMTSRSWANCIISTNVKTEVMTDFSQDAIAFSFAMLQVLWQWAQLILRLEKLNKVIVVLLFFETGYN